MDYLICQIGARQYLVKPGEVIEVDKLKAEGEMFSCEKVLLLSDHGNVEIGRPYLNKKVNFEVLETIKKPKVRVATYKAKVNSRTVTGQRREVTKVKLIESRGKEVYSK